MFLSSLVWIKIQAEAHVKTGWCISKSLFNLQILPACILSFIKCSFFAEGTKHLSCSFSRSVFCHLWFGCFIEQIFLFLHFLGWSYTLRLDEVKMLPLASVFHRWCINFHQKVYDVWFVFLWSWCSLPRFIISLGSSNSSLIFLVTLMYSS